MPSIVLLPLTWLLVLVVNVAPAFMPPTWAVLAAFHIARPELPLLPLTVGGAMASAAGRTGLALLSRRASRALPERELRNAEALGAFFSRHQRPSLVLLFGYCLGPLPSNPLFIAAGLGKVRLRAVASTFFVSRAIADTFWVWTAGQAYKSLLATFEESLTSWQAVALQIASLGLVVLLLRLPWRRWLDQAVDDVEGDVPGDIPTDEKRRTPPDR